jgi:lipoprotein-anchoring transpeptidase ErfK/SrfK
MNRRQILYVLAVPAVLAASKARASDEPFPIFESEAGLVAYKFRRREVAYETSEPVGTIIVDSRKRYLFHVLGEGRAIRYGVGVGKRGFAWSGTAVIGRKTKWPTWTPTPEQMERLPITRKWAEGMPGGSGNPLGARAMYLFQGKQDTLYRIHGTEVPSSIGRAVSSGCIRMINADVADLYERAGIGTRVVVLDPGPAPKLFGLLD